MGFRNALATALRLLSVRMDPQIYLQNSPPSLSLPLPLLPVSIYSRMTVGKKSKAGEVERTRNARIRYRFSFSMFLCLDLIQRCLPVEYLKSMYEKAS